MISLEQNYCIFATFVNVNTKVWKHWQTSKTGGFLTVLINAQG